MNELLQQITHQGVTPKDLQTTTNVSRATLTRHLKQLVEEGLIVNNDGVYSKLRTIPTVGELYDKMMTYHQQQLMDWKYRRKQKSTQSDLTLQWIIDNPFVIKGNISDYDEDQLQDNILIAYSTFQRNL